MERHPLVGLFFQRLAIGGDSLVLWIEERTAPDRDAGLALAISPSCMPMSPSRTSAHVNHFTSPAG